MKTPLSLFILGLLSLCPQSAAAQPPGGVEGYPARSVKLIAPYPAGAAVDLIGRVVAQKLSAAMGSQFYVENLPGAGGTTGTGMAARTPADGYTIFMATVAHTMAPGIYKKLSYDFEKDFDPITIAASVPTFTTPMLQRNVAFSVSPAR